MIREVQSIGAIVLKALALAMAVATFVLNIMGELDSETAIFFLSLGLIGLAISALQQPVSPDIGNSFQSKDSKSMPEEKSLSDRELEIVNLLGKSMSNREIAERLYLAEGTVKNYLTAIMQKLDAHSRDDAVRRAKDLGLI